MAGNPSIDLAPNVTAPNAAYPYGSAKNETVPGLFDGSAYKLVRANDVFGMQQALLFLSSIVPSGTADTVLVSQYIQAIVEIAAGRGQTAVDSGIVNAYVLGVQANQQAPQSLYNGMLLSFEPLITNTGAATVNPFGLGITNLRRLGGAVLSPGDLVAGEFIDIRYNASAARFELVAVIFTALSDYAWNAHTRNGAFTNNFGRPIEIRSTITNIGTVSITVAGVLITQGGGTGIGGSHSVSAWVPAGATYNIVNTVVGGYTFAWR